MATTYYTYDPETKRLTAAPRAIRTARGITFNAPASEYAAIGAYPRNDAYAPDGEPPDGKMWSRTGGWTLRDGAWCADWEAVDIPPPAPRTFSKYALEAALFDAGVLAEVDAFIDSQTVANGHGQTMPLRRKYDTALTFDEGNPYFSQFKAALQTALGWTDERVEAVLAASVKE